MSWTQEHSANGLQNRRKRVGSRKEQALQKQIIDYVRYAMRYNGRPLTDWLFHVPNGGARSVVEGAIFKGLGVKPGVPDLVLPILSGGYGGLWIELKDQDRPLTDAQSDYHQRLREAGQCVTTSRSLDEVVQLISSYMLKAPGQFEHRVARTT
jgi:hypothetical protein